MKSLVQRENQKVNFTTYSLKIEKLTMQASGSVLKH